MKTDFTHDVAVNRVVLEKAIVTLRQNGLTDIAQLLDESWRPLDVPDTFDPMSSCWPHGLEQNKVYSARCDDAYQTEDTYVSVLIAIDGDAHISAQQYGAGGQPNPFPSVRVRNFAGGGRNLRTHQALLWLAQAMRLDAIAPDH